ncbi:hypothetical protein PENTCL1PPCAC_19854, partial [Pristionchus entomophagus]
RQQLSVVRSRRSPASWSLSSPAARCSASTLTSSASMRKSPASLEPLRPESSSWRSKRARGSITPSLRHISSAFRYSHRSQLLLMLSQL